MSPYDEEILGGFPTDEIPTPLNLLSYAARVAELLRSPGALEHWRQQCQESFRESLQRQEQSRAWHARREVYLPKEPVPSANSSQEPPPEGWVWQQVRVFSPDGSKTWLAGIWVPPEFAAEKAPYVGGPLPFSPRQALSLADCYLVLALVHDAERRDGSRITPFSPDDPLGQVFYSAQETHLRHLNQKDRLTLGDCLARIEADLMVSMGLQSPAAENARAGKPLEKKPKRSTHKGEACVKIIAALSAHHQYDTESCLNTEPIGVRELARKAKVALATVSEFFAKEFKGHDRYQVLCRRDTSGLVATLKLLRGEYSPHIFLFGRTPPGEGRAREDWDD